jgi:CRISPR/Cas system-associated exonuclease Cas4 (RecB family)
MQYRYYNGSALPPSRPVQMWYGEFIHGVLEGAFGMWRADPRRYPFPWPCTPIPDAPTEPPGDLAANDLRVIGWPIEEALAHEGKRARSRRARVSAYRPDLQGTFEVIVDYKGSHRPATAEDYWQLGEWQVQTYAWLRQRQQLGYPVAAGILIYVNELAPSSDDVRRIRSAIQKGETDIAPNRGDPDYYALNTWTAGAAPSLTEAFRYRRAIRVIPVTQRSIDNATGQFDRIVAEIESRVRDEEVRGSIRDTWPPTCDSAETCVACDFRHFCPRPAASRQELATAEAAGDDDDA